jgi:exonuclease SbcD
VPTADPLRVLHFADAHIDIANFGRHDPETALPVRVMDFLKSLDEIVDTAVAEQVDLVIFAGDAYKDRNPQPTFQREWGKRMMRLSQAGIPTLMLVGNHDVSPASGRANTLQEFSTLDVPRLHVGDGINLVGPETLGVAAQVITVPWVSRSRLLAREEILGKPLDEVLLLMEEKVSERILQLIDTADPDIPLILTAHASVQGATYGSERAVMLGHELVLSGQIVNDRRLDYVALGHIHKHQALTGVDGQPPIVYPGSIERIDFGEAGERKGFVLAEIRKGHTEWQFVRLDTRRFLDIVIDTPDADAFMETVMNKLPSVDKVSGAICRVQLSYPRDWEPLVDDKAIEARFEGAFSLHIQKHRHSEKRTRLGDTAALESLSRAQLLEKYWQSIGLEREEAEQMQNLANEILASETE